MEKLQLKEAAKTPGFVSKEERGILREEKKKSKERAKLA